MRTGRDNTNKWLNYATNIIMAELGWCHHFYKKKGFRIARLESNIYQRDW